VLYGTSYTLRVMWDEVRVMWSVRFAANVLRVTKYV